jgi:hypothetical protein
MTRIAIRHVTRAERDAKPLGQRDLIERVECYVDLTAMTNDQIREEMDSLRATILHHAAAPNGFQEDALQPLLVRHEDLRVELNRRAFHASGPNRSASWPSAQFETTRSAVRAGRVFLHPGPVLDLSRWVVGLGIGSIASCLVSSSLGSACALVAGAGIPLGGVNLPATPEPDREIARGRQQQAAAR